MKKQQNNRKKKLGAGKRILAMCMAALMILSVTDGTNYGMNQVQAQSMQETEAATAEEIETETVSESEPETDREPETETQEETEEATESETESIPESGNETEAETESETQTKPETEEETETESETETETETQTEAETESRTETEEETETESETTAETEPALEAETMIEAEPETEITGEEDEQSVSYVKKGETGRYFIFANNAKHLEYQVTENEDVRLVKGRTFTYEVELDVETFEFSIIAEGKYEPVIASKDERTGEESTLEYTEKTKKKGKTVYKYSIDLSETYFIEDVLTITETIAQEKVKLTFQEEEVDIVSASINGKEILPVEEESADGCTYEIAYGSVVTIQAAARENCKITGAVTTGASTKKEKTKADGFTFSIKVLQDSETVITSEALYTPQVYEGEKPVEAAKGVHTVTYGKLYTLSVQHGENQKADISSIKLLQGKKEAKSTVIISEDKKTALLTIDRTEAGKKLTVKITTGEGAQVSTATLKVLPSISKVSVAGVKKGKLTQTADSVKEYKLTINPKTAANTLAAEVTAPGENPTEEEIASAQEAVKAQVEGNKLVVTTLSEKVQEDAAVIKLYNQATSTEESRDYVTGGTFTVSTKAPELVNIKPSIALKKADDVSLTLTLGAKKAETPNRGKVYYKVEITPAEPKEGTIPDSITEATAEPFYIEKTGATQEACFVVNNCGAGNGQAWKYDVKVTLFQTGSDAELTKDTEEDSTVFCTAEGKEARKKGLATKNPCYETKLKLKKGTTTIYTSQEKIVVATVQFGKDTTFKGLTVKDVSHGKNSRLDLEVVDNQILVSVQYYNYYVIGEHTLEVTAEAPDGQSGASARIKINIVPAIEQLTVKSPTKMYKADKKSSSISASVVCNSDLRYEPYRAKVAWSIVDEEGNPFDEEDALYGMLKVKNGKVTLNKKYVISANEADNRFRIKATAADFKGNTTCGYSKVITISDETWEIGDVILAHEVLGTYKVLARSGDTISFEQLNGDEFYAVKKGVPEKDEYTEEEIIDWREVTVTSGTKAVKLDSLGGIYRIYKPFKNANFTVKLQDGSGKKATLKNLTITYAKIIDMGADIDCYTYFTDCLGNEEQYKWGVANDDETDTRVIDFYNAAGMTQVSVRVEAKTYYNRKWWTGIHISEIPMYNYTVKWKGCTVVSQDDSTYKIIMDGKEASMILKYTNAEGEKIEKEYTIRNLALCQKEALVLEQTGELRVGYQKETQTITYTLPDSYDWEGKYAMVTPEMILDRGTWKKYELFVENTLSFMGKPLPVSDEGTISLLFNNSNYTNIQKGTYVVFINFGTVDEEGNFIPDVNPTKITYNLK